MGKLKGVTKNVSFSCQDPLNSTKASALRVTRFRLTVGGPLSMVCFDAPSQGSRGFHGCVRQNTPCVLSGASCECAGRGQRADARVMCAWGVIALSQGWSGFDECVRPVLDELVLQHTPCVCRRSTCRRGVRALYAFTAERGLWRQRIRCCAARRTFGHHSGHYAQAARGNRLTNTPMARSRRHFHGAQGLRLRAQACRAHRSRTTC